MGSMLVAYHFLSREFALAFSNKNPMSAFLKIFARLKNLTEGMEVLVCNRTDSFSSPLSNRRIE